jgi:hypothetical protein
VSTKLLERAARSIGLCVVGDDEYTWGKGGLLIAGEGGATSWNPLTDDGDAFRLFVRLPFRTLYVSEIGVTVSWARSDGSGHGFKCDEYATEHNGDLNAAARAAIVRAAAALNEASL